VHHWFNKRSTRGKETYDDDDDDDDDDDEVHFREVKMSKLKAENVPFTGN
jgi:hypothetical protein